MANVARGSAASRGYDARWRRLRLMFLREHPLCALCGAPATEVDHIIPIRLGGSNDAANLQALCKSCHSAKTAREDGRWGRGG
jgi:5-methylcytosine-specific restriction protein A